MKTVGPLHRVLGHILVSFLAYVLWKTLAKWMQGAGLGEDPRTVLEEFSRIRSGDVVLPTRGTEGVPGDLIRLRCVTAADDHQRVLLNRLGLRLPKRLLWAEQSPQGDPSERPTGCKMSSRLWPRIAVSP